MTVRCDEKLRRLFGADSVQLGRMSELVKANLTPPEPVQLRYTIKWVGWWDWLGGWLTGWMDGWLGYWVGRELVGRERTQLGAQDGAVAQRAAVVQEMTRCQILILTRVLVAPRVLQAPRACIAAPGLLRFRHRGANEVRCWAAGCPTQRSQGRRR